MAEGKDPLPIAAPVLPPRVLKAPSWAFPTTPARTLKSRSAASIARRAAEEAAARSWFDLDQLRPPPKPRRVVDPTHANEGVAQWYCQALLRLLDLAQLDLHTVLAGVEFPAIGFAQDAPSPIRQLTKVLRDWGVRTIDRFEKMSLKIADDFATQNQTAAEIAQRAAFKRAGWTVQFRPTKRSIEAYQAVAAENVGLIRSIGAKYHTDVQERVWDAVRKGGGLYKLSIDLQKTYGISARRAALISRDQNVKAKAVIEATRAQELGITRGIWHHSHAGKEPRPTHVAMDGEEFVLSQGMWDSDEGQHVWPGQLIQCRCTFSPIIEGFEL